MNLQWQRSTSTRAPRISLSFLLAALSSAGYGDELTATPPQHWFISGQQPGQSQMEYSGALDRTIAYEGSGSGLLKSTADTAHNGTLMQVSSAGVWTLAPPGVLSKTIPIGKRSRSPSTFRPALWHFHMECKCWAQARSGSTTSALRSSGPSIRRTPKRSSWPCAMSKLPGSTWSEIL
jgi:hypothetical protein